MLTTDNLTGVDPAPGAGPDPGHGLGMVSTAEKIKFMCLTSVRVMGSVFRLDHSSCLTLLDQDSTYQRKTDICTQGKPECSQDPFKNCFGLKLMSGSNQAAASVAQ